MATPLSRRRILSLGIAVVAVVLAAAPLPGVRRELLVAVGSELEGPMQELEQQFERVEGGIDLRLQVQGAQDMVNQAVEGRDDRPRVLIPANQEHLNDLRAGLAALGSAEPFVAAPQPIARTLLTAVVWAERAGPLFPQGRFEWQRLRRAAAAGQWADIGGPAAWGSVDLRVTDPLRSNSGQLTLALWCRGQGGDSCAASLKRSVYRPARSTDILLREFISGGPNEGDLAMVYESSALARSAEASLRHPGGYRLLFPDPTYETVLAAAVVRGSAAGSERDGERFVAFLKGAAGQSILQEYGFRGADGGGGSPAGSRVQRLPPPRPEAMGELLRFWQQAG